MRLGDLTFRLVGISSQFGDPRINPAFASDTIKLFDKARSSIKVVSGGFSSRMYCNDGVVNALERALKRECTVEVVAGPKADEECTKFWITRGVSVYVLDQWPKRHFVVVDGKHVRLEDPHSQEQEKQVQFVVYNFKNTGKLERRFEELKKQAKALEAA